MSNEIMNTSICNNIPSQVELPSTTITTPVEEEKKFEKLITLENDKVHMNYLIEVTEILLKSIWKSKQIVQPTLCPLKDYLNHVINQSKTTVYTLKCALLYLIRISRQLQNKKWRSKVRLFCGRRMFLGSLIIATKYLYDRTFSNAAWAKIFGLNSTEINLIQMDFLEALNFDLYISEELDNLWSQMIENFVEYVKSKEEKEENDASMSLPISPVSPAKESNHTIHSEESLTSSLRESMDIEEIKKLEEYRPLVKVLIQVVFLYSKNNELPSGPKEVIELPNTPPSTPKLLIMTNFSSCRRPNARPCISYHLFQNHSASAPSMDSQGHATTCRSCSHLSSSSLSLRQMRNSCASYNHIMTMASLIHPPPSATTTTTMVNPTTLGWSTEESMTEGEEEEEDGDDSTLCDQEEIQQETSTTLTASASSLKRKRTFCSSQEGENKEEEEKEENEIKINEAESKVQYENNKKSPKDTMNSTKKIKLQTPVSEGQRSPSGEEEDEELVKYQTPRCNPAIPTIQDIKENRRMKKSYAITNLSDLIHNTSILSSSVNPSSYPCSSLVTSFENPPCHIVKINPIELFAIYNPTTTTTTTTTTDAAANTTSKLSFSQQQITPKSSFSSSRKILYNHPKIVYPGSSRKIYHQSSRATSSNEFLRMNPTLSSYLPSSSYSTAIRMSEEETMASATATTLIHPVYHPSSSSSSSSSSLSSSSSTTTTTTTFTGNHSSFSAALLANNNIAVRPIASSSSHTIYSNPERIYPSPPVVLH